MGTIGIIGGSGLYELDGCTVRERMKVQTPYGMPSDELVLGTFGDREVVFLSRHGAGHRIAPSAINYRANIYALKKAGVSRIISVSACGSLKKELEPTHFVLPDQFIDRTRGKRADTFFDEGMVAHVGFAEPVCGELVDVLFLAAEEANVRTHRGGTYVNMEGPAFSTKAESLLYRSWGADIIGMTNLTEAKLAREAQICYATLASVTDYDCWFEQEVSVEMIIANLTRSVANAKRILRAALARMPAKRSCRCATALANAVVTAPDKVPPQVRERLSPLFGGSDA